ncbi:ATP12 family chaperone protein [Dongia sp.]|uniref:ATP12 family chaperone protein n=1 Tax=Dongia sp. TaxID=1977262 RepID=UPI0035AF6774
MQATAPRRFYRTAAAQKGESGWNVALDGKLLRSPGKLALDLPSRALAQAIAAEWDAQSEHVRPHSMPLMQLAATAIDRVRPERARIVPELAGYGATDLVCYRAAEPPVLVEREAQAWDALLDWLRRRYDVSLLTTSGIVAVAQPPATMEALTRVIDGHDDFALAALATLVHAAGSLVIGLAVMEGEITPEQAAHAAQLDELYQSERWGEDQEAIAHRVAQLADLVAARRFLDLLAQD